MKKIFLLTLFLMFLCSQVWAGVAHYADLGDAGSSNLGTFAEPFNTMATINSHAFAEGDDLYFAADMNEIVATHLVIDWDGNAGDRAIIGAYDGDGDFDITGSARPILDGNNTIPSGDWTGVIHKDAGTGYITIQDLRINNSRYGGIRVTSAPHTTVGNCYIYKSRYHGIFFVKVVSGIVEDSIVEWANWDSPVQGGIVLNASNVEGASINSIVRRNKVFHCHEGIGLYKKVTYSVVEYNVCYDNRPNIYIGNSRYCTVRYNLSYYSADAGSWYGRDPGIILEQENQANSGSCFCGYNKVYGNLIGGAGFGIEVKSTWQNYHYPDPGWECPQTNNLIYNNTIVDSEDYNFRFIDHGFTNWADNECKNNISYTITGGSNHIYDASPSGFTFSHNNYDVDDPGGNANDNYQTGVPGLSKTSGWQSLTAGDVDGTDFKLLDTNSCEDKGTNLGGTPDNPYYNTLNLDNSDFKAFTFEFFNQNDQGSTWDIGADIYQTGEETPPTNNDCSDAIIHLKLDTDGQDSTVNDNDVTWVGGPSFTGSGVSLNGSSQYGYRTNLSHDILSISAFSNFNFTDALGDGASSPICGEYDTGDDKRVWPLLITDATGEGDGDDVFKFCIGHTGGTDRVCLESTYALSPSTQYSVLSVYNHVTDVGYLYIHDMDGVILNGGTGETLADFLDDPGNGSYTQNVESVPFTLGTLYNSGSPSGYFKGTIYEVAVYNSVKTQANGQEFALTTYSDAAAMEVTGMSSACSNITAAGTMTWAVGWPKEPYIVGTWTIEVDFDYPTTTQIMSYTGKWNDEHEGAPDGWVVHTGDIWKKTTYIEPTSVKADTNVLTENDGNYGTLSADQWDWNASILYVNVGGNPKDEKITPSPWETYVAIDVESGWRQNSFGDAQIGADITLPSGVTIKDAQDEAAVVVGALTTLGSYPANTVAIPFPSTNPKTFSSSSTLADAQVAGFYAIGDDFLGVTEANALGAADMSGSDGTSEHPITLDGGGLSHPGNQIYGDDWVIKRVIHNSTVELGLGDTHKYSLIPEGDILKVPEGATGCYIHDDGIRGTLDLDEQVGADTLDAELLTNGNMETGDPPTGWNSSNATLDGVADERDGGAGSQSLKMTLTAGYGICYRSIVTEAGKLYEFNFWHKVTAGDSQYVRVIDLGGDSAVLGGAELGFLTDTAWTNDSFYFVGASASASIQLKGVSDTDVVYFDDVSVKEVTSDTGIFNTWITTVDPAGLGADEPVLFFNCAFVESEAVIEAKNASDVLFFDDECQFEINTTSCFRNYAGDNFHLTANSPLREAGEAYLNTVNVDTSDWPDAGTDDYGAVNDHTFTGNHDTISDGTISKDNCLMLAADNANGAHYVYIVKANNGMAAQADFKMTYSFYVPAAQTHADGFIVKYVDGSGGTTLATHTGINGAWTTNTIYWSAAENATMTLAFYLLDGATTTFIGDNNGTGDLLYLHNIVIDYDSGGTDLDGRVTPHGSHAIGCYEYYPTIGEGSGMWSGISPFF